MKLLDSDGRANHIVPLSNGALRPPHIKQIGPAFPLFLLLEDMVTTGEGTNGVVLNGRPVRDAELAKKLGLHPKAVAEQRRRLQHHRYILATRTGRGYIIRVRKSKKWAWLQSLRRSQTAPSSTADGANGLPQMEPNGSRRPPTLAPSRSDITLQEHKTEKRPAKKQQAEPRFQPIVEAYFKGSRDRGIEPEFNQSDGQQLKTWLGRHRNTPREKILATLGNAFRSTDPFPLRPGFRLREFVAHESKYQLGPLHKPVPGNGRPAPQRLAADSRMPTAADCRPEH